MKAKIHGMYEIDDDIWRMNFDVLEKWLSQTYWSPRIGKEEIYKGPSTQLWWLVATSDRNK